MAHGRRLAVAALLASALAFYPSCGADKSPSPSTGPSPAPRGANANGHLDVAVVIDPDAREYSEGDIRRVLSVANDKLRELTGETLAVREVVSATAHGANASSLAASYAVALDPAQTIPPEAVVVATHDSTAHTYGGYSMSLDAPPSWGFVNEYASPTVGSNKYYLVAIEFTHPYARCGYDDALNHISSVSIDGECRNSPGLVCLALNGRWVCPNATNDLYMNADYFAACSIVHEIVHPFGKEGNYDHYGTPTCVSRTGMSAATAADLRAAQTYCGMCPDVYQQFRHR